MYCLNGASVGAMIVINVLCTFTNILLHVFYCYVIIHSFLPPLLPFWPPFMALTQLRIFLSKDYEESPLSSIIVSKTAVCSDFAFSSKVLNQVSETKTQ